MSGATQMGRRPDFLIIGGQKCGTTSVHEYLRRSDSFYLASTKELHFFDRRSTLRDPAALESYLSNFDGTRPDQLAGESTPDYLASRIAPARISAQLPDVRLVAILRNPVHRAYSGFRHAQRAGAVPKGMTFEEAMERDARESGAPWTDTVGGGCYATHLERYLGHFPREQILVVCFERLVAHPKPRMKEIVEFLCRDRIAVPEPPLNWLPLSNRGASSRAPRISQALLGRSTSGSPLHRLTTRLLLSYDAPPPMAASTQARLETLYRPWNDRLWELLGETWGEWSA